MVGDSSLTLSADNRLYVIGDIHGRSDLLDKIADLIRQDLADRPVADAFTITLGDYVDRGPDSRGVLDRLTRNTFPTPYVPLKGNHEEMLQLFLVDPEIGADWRRWGGLETIQSYGVSASTLMIGKGFEQTSRAFRAAVPDEHLAFISSLKLSISVGKYFLCHAGVRPGIPLDQQRPTDLLWIRDEFLSSKTDFGKIVVHGHAPVEEPEVRPNRINVDTGAFTTGCLSCLVLERDAQRYLQAR
ncbi:serine/threonine protein phosphatase 1 [Bradyrhizobium sp. USDA 4524]|uniref:metallophosphoesterase family protein n=1 Tax=unclassified Bradyrhizobium TaxID=2631580 RepID=UPI00209EB6AF|nr:MULTISPECIES: metallophosphoesterase family protein [unclassified Bradyrhizobium]MCP1845582.1 serine/threonine protein phosphatase 1 [Bradyrhizobium sp. USDA 4538]MCP1907095.1 serine/threonine protein phosphatase 1 [Bradyrhizobium sp. USDA 4537]MCP1985570.1 serine/threonine protein phosphatase 1 [Bradyrhizobium sp. USDA 4539]